MHTHAKAHMYVSVCKSIYVCIYQSACVYIYLHIYCAVTMYTHVYSNRTLYHLNPYMFESEKEGC